MCRQHNVGFGEGTITKIAIAEEHFGSATLVQTATPGPKTTKSNTNKKLGIGFPVFCIFFVTLHRPI